MHIAVMRLLAAGKLLNGANILRTSEHRLNVWLYPAYSAKSPGGGTEALLEISKTKQSCACHSLNPEFTSKALIKNLLTQSSVCWIFRMTLQFVHFLFFFKSVINYAFVTCAEWGMSYTDELGGTESIRRSTHYIKDWFVEVSYQVCHKQVAHLKKTQNVSHGSPKQTQN